MLEFHDPRGDVAVAHTPYDLSISIRGANQLTIGLLANGFPDSENFLRQVGDAIQAQEPGIGIEIYNKGNASIPANDDMLADIEANCQAVVAAYGH